MSEPLEEELQTWINKYRKNAELWGAETLRAIAEDDLGKARSAARQAARHALLAMQLENHAATSGPVSADESGDS